MKIFEKDVKIFLFDIYSYIRAKDLRSILGNKFWEKYLWSQWKRDKLSPRARYIRDKPFIEVNNIITDY